MQGHHVCACQGIRGHKTSGGEFWHLLTHDCCVLKKLVSRNTCRRLHRLDASKLQPETPTNRFRCLHPGVTGSGGTSTSSRSLSVSVSLSLSLSPFSLSLSLPLSSISPSLAISLPPYHFSLPLFLSPRCSWTC